MLDTEAERRTGGSLAYTTGMDKNSEILKRMSYQHVHERPKLEAKNATCGP